MDVDSRFYVQNVPHYDFLLEAMMRECGAMSCTVCSNSRLIQQKIVMLLRTVIRVKTSLNPPFFSICFPIICLYLSSVALNFVMYYY
jgi:hypothetical protein